MVVCARELINKLSELAERYEGYTRIDADCKGTPIAIAVWQLKGDYFGTGDREEGFAFDILDEKALKYYREEQPWNVVEIVTLEQYKGE